MKSAGKARNNGLYRHIRTSKEIIRNLLNYSLKNSAGPLHAAPGGRNAMKLKFTRKTWYFFLLAAAAMSMLGGFAVLGGMDFSGLELIVFCITGIAVLFLAAQKGAPAKDKRSYTLVFVLLMLSKLAAGGWAGDLCSALVWPGLLAIEYGHGRPIQRPLQLVCISEALRLLFWLLTKYAGMSALAFWTNIMFVLLACARGWAALMLYKTQEETL